MPIQTIRDPKTGEERRVYVAPAGMGEGAAPKPKAQPQPGGGFLGSLNDLNPMKQVSALGAGVSEFMRTGDINKGIAAASRGSAPATGLGRSVNRALVAGAQRAADDIRYEVNRAQMAQKQIAAGVSPYDVKVPSSGPGAPSAQNVRLPGIIDYDSLRVEPQNPVEDVAATIIEQVPFFVAGGPLGQATMGLARGVPGISKAVAGFERMTGGLQAAGGAKKVAGIFAEEAVSGAVPSMVATYYTNQPKEGTLSDALSSSVKGTPLEAIVAKGLLTNPSDTVEQARIRAALDDAIWSVPLGGTLGTGFRGVGAMKNATKRALVDAIHGTVKVAQADAATKDAVQAATSGTPAVAVAPGVPSAGTPAVRVISGKPTYSSQVYQGLRRQPLWEKTGVEIQGVLEPQAPQVRPAEAYTSQLNYSDVRPDAGPLNASGKRYAEALAGQDQIAIETTSQKLQASFNNAAARLGIELGPNAASKSWSMWDIGKQLYMDANPAKSNKPYVLGNPLTNLQVQSDIVDRMLGFEITKGVDVEGKRLKSWQLTDIGRKAREEAGVDLGLALDPDSQRVIPSPTAPATPEAAALQLQQARADLVAATQRLQSEAAKEVVTAPEPVAVPEGQLPGMNQPAYGQVATIETSSVAAAPRTFQYKAEGQTTTGRSGSLAEENVYDPRYGGVISVWRDTQGELGNPGQVYVVNGHNRLELANRSGFPVINVQFIDAPTAADARLTGALQNIKDDKGTGVDAAKIFRETGMTIEDLRLQNVTLSGRLASEGVAMARLPQWLFDKVATGGLPTAKAVALGSAEGLDSAVISDVAKQAIKGKWTAEKIVQAMQEAKFAGTSTAPGGVLPGFEEMFKASNVKALIDVRTAAFKQLSVEMRALTAAAQTKNTAYLEAAGNAIDVEGSQAARRSAQEAVAVFNRVAGYEGPVRSILNELADQVPEGKDSSKIAASLVQFNLQRLRDAISEEMNGPRLSLEEAPVVPENAGNPVPIQAKPVDVAPVVDNKAISAALERQIVAQEAGDAELAGELGAWLNRRGVTPPAINDVEPPAIESPAALIDIPAAASQRITARTDENRITSAAESLSGWVNVPGAAPMPVEQALEIVRAKGARLDPDRIPGLNMDAARSDKAMGRTTPETEAVAAAYKQFYEFSADLPDLKGWQSVETGAGRTIGEGYTGATRITEREASELNRIAYQVSGIADFGLSDRIKVVYTESQARAYGDMSLVGRTAEIAGYYAPGTKFGGDAANDQIRVAMMAYGATKSFTQMLSTTYHESFHRLQRWFLNDAEQGVLARSEKALRELAAKNAESFGLNDNAAKFRDGTVGLKETTAEAFAGFARGLSVPGKPMEGFAKIKQLIDETINWLLTGGQYKTWDDVFEKAQLGDIKDRGPLGSVDDGIQYAADPPDPAEFARRIDQNMQALESGDLTPEDVARMGASDVRRITSRSGQTQYVPQASDQLIASNRALGEMLTSRAQQTGIGSYSQPAIVKAALDQLDRDGWAVEPTVQRLEAARRGDPRSQDDLVALAANVIQRDYLAAQNGMTAVEWQNAVDEGDRAAAMQRLWAGLEDQHRLDTALMTATRKDGQRLSVMQIKYDFDPTHRQVPAGTMLYHGTTEESAQAIMEEGFKASGFRSNLLGTGVYFAETSMYAGAYGEVAAAGDLPGDVRILDLVSMDKRIADLVQELGLGRLDKFEDTLLLTDAQKSAVREWAVGQGYSGIRFSPDFELAGGFMAPEVVIFDANVANRVVGSQAAVEPEIPATTESMKTDIDTEIANPLNTILGKIDPDIRADIEQGVMSADAVDMTETLSQIMVAGRTNPGMRAKFNSMVTKTDVGKLNQEMVVQMYRAALLWSTKTATKMLIGSTYRAITMPINQAITELGTAGIAKTMGDNKAAHQALRQAKLDIGMYGQYVSNITNAWRLTGESWKAGESLGNLGVSSTDIPQKNLRLNEQMSMFEEDADPANTLDNPWWLDPETTNMGALATRGAWKALMASQRAAGTFDTFFSSLIGPSAEWSRLMGLELDKAESRGLTGDEAWKTATKIVDERIESQWVDVITNGKVIQNGALTGVHAKAAMDWINFTDPLDVQFEPRTYEYGIAKAKEEGLTDTAEINRRATEWMQEDVPGWAQAGMGASRATSGLVPRLIQQALRHTPALGLLYPFPTSPANIVKSAARATGVLAPFVDTFYKDVFSQDRNTRARAIGEIATAYLTLVTGVMMVNSGWVEMTGPGSYDPQTRAKMQRLNRPSYSIRLRNPMTGQTTRWWDLQALDTVSNVFALIGQHVDTNNSLTKEDQKVLTSNMILAAADQMRIVGTAQFSKDMYKSIGEIFNLIGDLENKSFIPVEGQIDPFSSYVERRLAGFLPAIFNNTRKGVDPYQRAIEKSTLPAPFGFVHELGQRFANKTPGLSSTLPPVLHPLTGEPAVIDQVWGLNYMPADQPWLKGVVNAMSPLAFAPTREGTKDPVDVELARLSGRGTAFQVWSAGEFNVPNYKLTQVQLNKLAVITSQLVPPGRSGTLHQELTAMVAPRSSYWQLPPPSPSKATTSARAIRINKQISYYKPFIKDQFLATEPNLARMIEENKSTQGRAMFQAEYGMTWSPTPGNR